MGRTLKLVITGPFDAGKTQFVKTISDIDVVSTERKITRGGPGIKEQTTVAMDYGRATVGDDVLHLNGTPGQARFDFMWDILTREMHGFVVLIDSCELGTLEEARALVDLFGQAHQVPYLVAANKQDLDCAPSVDQIRRQLSFGSDVLVMPCVSTRKTSVQQVLKQLVDLIPS